MLCPLLDATGAIALFTGTEKQTSGELQRVTPTLAGHLFSSLTAIAHNVVVTCAEGTLAAS